MKKLNLINLIFILFFSCSDKLIRTERVCDRKIYIEIYERNQLGISYLTDSENFKLYIGQINFENERYSYKCMSDSVFIDKISTGLGNDSRYDKIVAEYKYDIKELKKGKRMER